MVNDYLAEKDKAEESQGKAKSQEDGYKVGTALGITARWKDYGVFFETPQKDFVMHLGGWFQYDSVWFGQSRGSAKQIGDFQDGDFFRRVRLQADGTVWQVTEYNMILGFENTQKSLVSLFEVWAGLRDLPGIGMLRIGRMVRPQGLEGDDTTTNKAMTFFERSSMSDAFYQNFASGLWQGNSIFDERFCYQSMIYRKDLGANSGDFFGDGEYCVAGRLTGLPIYQNNGRELVHVGVSGSWEHATRGGAELADPQSVRFRARPEQRDFSGDLDGTVHDGVLNPGNGNRIVDTGAIQAASSTILGTEFLWIRGPFSVQAEYAWTALQGAVIGGKSVRNVAFDGGYLQLSYFLTGENRTYDKRLGRLSPTYFAGPYTPFWFVRDENGALNWGIGAWEVAARYSHLNLDGGDGLIKGGVMDGITLGLNWYLNPNFKIQFEYMRDYRSHLGAGVTNGYVDGAGVRAQFAF
jgi:phosphate-selective porin OprO/OprP